MWARSAPPAARSLGRRAAGGWRRTAGARGRGLSSRDCGCSGTTATGPRSRAAQRCCLRVACVGAVPVVLPLWDRPMRSGVMGLSRSERAVGELARRVGVGRHEYEAGACERKQRTGGNCPVSRGPGSRPRNSRGRTAPGGDRTGPSEMVLGPRRAAVVRVHDPVIGGQPADVRPGDVVAEVVVTDTATTPSELTWMVGSHAWSVNVPLGVWLTFVGADQLWPPSSECDTMIRSSPRGCLGGLARRCTPARGGVRCCNRPPGRRSRRRSARWCTTGCR